jgi:ribonuclease PH
VGENWTQAVDGWPLMLRTASELRPVRFRRNFTRHTPGSVLVEFGRTVVLCTASVDDNVPPWLKTSDPPRGWITAEYNMLPGSTHPRKPRDRMRVDGRTTEIQRLIGRSLRAVADLAALGPIQITVDCDVLQADGGTRTAAITGGFVALVDAVHSVRNRLPDRGRYPLRDSLAAVSAGIVNGEPRLDLDYTMDFAASVDMNVVMTGRGEFVELQGTGEEATFNDKQLAALLALARKGIRELTAAQQKALGRRWPWQG